MVSIGIPAEALVALAGRSSSSAQSWSGKRDRDPIGAQLDALDQAQQDNAARSGDNVHQSREVPSTSDQPLLQCQVRDLLLDERKQLGRLGEQPKDPMGDGLLSN